MILQITCITYGRRYQGRRTLLILIESKVNVKWTYPLAESGPILATFIVHLTSVTTTILYIFYLLDIK